MYQSKFLLNRQKIFNPLEIHAAVASYFKHLPAASQWEFFYRLEWYKIGVVVPFTVYSSEKPLMKLMPECQLLDSNSLDELPADTETFAFAIFAVPTIKTGNDSQLDENAINDWLKKELAGAATINDTTFGPNNCLYYEKDGVDCQQQTVTIKGSLKVKDRKKLDKIRRQPIGLCAELGCGMLYLEK